MRDVLVELPRQVSWRASEDAPELAYGPGRVLVPQELADLLQERGLITWQDAEGKAPTWEQVEVLSPNAELASDFPAREYLFMAGHYTYKSVAELTEEQIADLRGVGESRTKQIAEAQAIIRAKLPKRGQTQASAIGAEAESKEEADGSQSDAG